MSERKELQPQPSTDKRREEIADLVAAHVRKINRIIAAGMHERDAIYEAADAVMALPPLEDDWQDIASAPKEGVPFWAYQPGREQFVCWEQDTRDGVVWMDEIDSEPKPTHWRPLPAPPSNPKAQTVAEGGGRG